MPLAPLLLATGGLTLAVSLFAGWGLGAYSSTADPGRFTYAAADGWTYWAWEAPALAAIAALLLVAAAGVARTGRLPRVAAAVLAVLAAAGAGKVAYHGLDGGQAQSGGPYVALLGLGLALLGLLAAATAAGAPRLLAAAGGLALLVATLAPWYPAIGWVSYTPLSEPAGGAAGPFTDPVPDLPVAIAGLLALALLVVAARRRTPPLVPAALLAGCVVALAVTVAARDGDAAAGRRVYEYPDVAAWDWAAGEAAVLALVGLAVAAAGLAALLATRRGRTAA